MYEKLRILKGKGKLTPYLHDVVMTRLAVLPTSMHAKVINDATFMSKIGVRSDEDHKIVMYILMHARKIAEDIAGNDLNAEQMAKLSHIIFAQKDYYPVDTIFNFYRAAANGLKELEIPIKKMAYPVTPTGTMQKRPYNVNKWMQSMRQIYSHVHSGVSSEKAFEVITKDWDVMERFNFEHWMRFYQEGTHEKYKTAQQEQPRYLELGGMPAIPIEHLRSNMSGMPNMDRYEANDEADAAKAEEEALQREELKKKIKSIDSRLRSAFKLMSDPHVQRELNKTLDISIHDWLKQLQDLQRYIVLTPLKRVSTIDDIIVKRANQLSARGAPQAAQLLMRYAQEEPDAPAAPPAAGDLKPGGDSPLPDDMTEGGPDELGDELGDMPPGEDLEPGGDEAMDMLADRMNFKEDEGDVADISNIDDESDLLVHAQEMPPEAAMPAPEPEADIVVEEEPEAVPGPPAAVPGPTSQQSKPRTSDIVGDATIESLVTRLETVSNILKNREIPRQLSIIDLEMDSLGIASYFPTLAEALKSSLESNQYMSSRIEDILAKLRGSLEPDMPLELTTSPEDEVETDGTLEEVRQSLEKNEQREKDRKERRQKARDEEEMEQAPGPPAPELEEPVEVERSAPQRVPTR
jgi:hypothetical protein